jgi:hypothetical protein
VALWHSLDSRNVSIAGPVLALEAAARPMRVEGLYLSIEFVGCSSCSCFCEFTRVELDFTRVGLDFTRVELDFTRLHSTSLDFTRVHSS